MKELKPVSEEDLLSLFRGKDFRRLLRKSALYTFDTGYENGFLVARDLQNRLHYSNVVRGTTEDNSELQDVEILGFGEERHSEDIYAVLHLHFHPDVENYVTPSGSTGDLSWFNELRNKERVNCRPVCAVGQIDNSRNGELIMVQEKTETPLSYILLTETVEELNELFQRGYPNTEDVVGVFNQTGSYKATSLEFRLNGKGILIPDDELQKVRIFAYTPTLKKIND